MGAYYKIGIVILLLVASAAVYRVRNPAFRSYGCRVSFERCLASSMETQLLAFNALNGRYPTTEEGIRSLSVRPASMADLPNWTQLLSEEIDTDRWGMHYRYVCPGMHNPATADFYSCGEDRMPGTADDIGNWRR